MRHEYQYITGRLTVSTVLNSNLYSCLELGLFENCRLHMTQRNGIVKLNSINNDLLLIGIEMLVDGSFYIFEWSLDCVFKKTECIHCFLSYSCVIFIRVLSLEDGFRRLKLWSWKFRWYYSCQRKQVPSGFGNALPRKFWNFGFPKFIFHGLYHLHLHLCYLNYLNKHKISEILQNAKKGIGIEALPYLFHFAEYVCISWICNITSFIYLLTIHQPLWSCLQPVT